MDKDDHIKEKRCKFYSFIKNEKVYIENSKNKLKCWSVISG